MTALSKSCLGLSSAYKPEPVVGMCLCPIGGPAMGPLLLPVPPTDKANKLLRTYTRLTLGLVPLGILFGLASDYYNAVYSAFVLLMVYFALREKPHAFVAQNFLCLTIFTTFLSFFCSVDLIYIAADTSSYDFSLWYVVLWCVDLGIALVYYTVLSTYSFAIYKELIAVADTLAPLELSQSGMGAPILSPNSMAGSQARTPSSTTGSNFRAFDGKGHRLGSEGA